MSSIPSRRDFFKLGGAAAALGLVNVRKATPQERARVDRQQKTVPAAAGVQPVHGFKLPKEFQTFSRQEPSYGGEPDSDTYMGKLVPALRRKDLPPVPFEAPDLPKLPYTLVEGWKEFHLTAEPVRREFLPNFWMDVYGYDGNMPGPVIEATEGDWVRIVLHNHFPDRSTMHFHGAEDEVESDGVPGVTQTVTPSGESWVYEFKTHQDGTFFYHAHIPMQEGDGAVGWLILHPRENRKVMVDRDFGLIFMNWIILPNNTIPVTWEPFGSWQTINGRSGPYTTPMVVKQGERVRIRFLNFSKDTPHSLHIEGHTFWVPGYEGLHQQTSAWEARNTVATHIAQAFSAEFIANNPGDWPVQCQMSQHVMNFVPHARTVGPRIRDRYDIGTYRDKLHERPMVQFPSEQQRVNVPGFPQKLARQGFTDEEKAKLLSRREVAGMREGWFRFPQGLMTILRVLPEDLYNRVMNSDEEIKSGEIYDELVRRVKKRRAKWSS